jgi:hypothetical protein
VGGLDELDMGWNNADAISDEAARL